MPHMDGLLNQISAKLSKNNLHMIWMSVIDLDYAYGQMKISQRTLPPVWLDDIIDITHGSKEQHTQKL